MSFPLAGAHGALQLLTETDPVSELIRRAVRLEASADGRSVLLIDVDARKPGIQREARYEITPAELIAAIRTHSVERRTDLSREDHAESVDCRVRA